MKMLLRFWPWAVIAIFLFQTSQAAQKPIAGIGGNENPLLVAVMGPTGSGKSSFINTILGTDRFKVGKRLGSETKWVQDELVQIDGRPIRIVDTPGFDDTNLTDTQVLEMIVAWMSVQYKQKTKFAGILYLRDITESKMKGSDMTNLRMFRALCGTNGLENVIIVTTKWNLMAYEPGVAEAREEELRSDYLKPLLSSGAEFARDHGTSKSSRTILRKILHKNKAFYLDFQREIVDEGKRLNEIEAGRVLQEHLLELEERHKANLQALSEELTQEHSEKMREALEEQHRKTAEEAMEKAKHQQGQLEETFTKRFAEQEQIFRKMLEDLHREHEAKMEKASEEEKEKLLQQKAELEKALKAADKGDSSLMWNVLGQAALTTGVNFLLPIVLAQLAPKLGFGGTGFSNGGGGGGAAALPVAPAATAEMPQILNVNWYTDPIMRGMHITDNAAKDWGQLPSWDVGSDDFSVSDWLIKGLEGVVDIAVPLIEYIIDD
ncbi:P-loop containing nucleoside triphosphate hydrolase protein [Lasiosphaeria ovina]|uniref:P-loop containing nucleoside triphosphate hydrolase protein n=1 Tax=Lasiosphaeria ovina TaxID=92902 RepID=A0AAE0JTH5_9PEZI|nr:P-loop containing nucleoside triphosphate hydrolase protein [Lasiosphaeria ovina]